MQRFPLSRREALAGIAATSAVTLVSTRVNPAPVSDAEAQSLLNSVAENLLRQDPTAATALGIDTGPRASYRYRLGDRSAAGQARGTPVRRMPAGHARARVCCRH